jgi:hypothetical protein
MAMENLKLGVRLIRRVTLAAQAAVWHPPALDHLAVDAYWLKRSAENPSFFDGLVYVLIDGRMDGDAFSGTCAPIPFRAFLYWMDHGSPEAGFRDISGAAVLISEDNQLILGQNADQTLSGGRASFFSGFIDARDINNDQSIDLDGNVERELSEETGLSATDVQRDPSYYVVCDGRIVSIGVVVRAPQPAMILKHQIMSHCRGEAAPEIANVVVIKSAQDLQDPRVRPHVSTLGATILKKLHRVDQSSAKAWPQETKLSRSARGWPAHVSK